MDNDQVYNRERLYRQYTELKKRGIYLTEKKTKHYAQKA